MKLLVIGAGMMGAAAAYDMARTARVDEITLADADGRRARDAAARIHQLTRLKKVKAVVADATMPRPIARLMKEHDGALSAVPYFLNLDLARAAVAAGCHFVDLGGNNKVVRRELALARKAAARQIGIAPDCGLSPGMASILGGELVRRIGGRADALKVYVGGLPQKPEPPFNYQLVFSVEGLINEYSEPAKILRGGKVVEIDPLTEIEDFQLDGFPLMEAFHTSGGTSTMPETFAGSVGECFEKTIRYRGHAAMLRALYDFGFFSSQTRQVGKLRLAPRQVTSQLFVEKSTSDAPEMTILRVEAHRRRRVCSFTLVDKTDRRTGLTSMMRTTAWPASIVLQMLVSGEIARHGAVLQERDVPAQLFRNEMAARGLEIRYSETPARRSTTKAGA